MRNKIRALRSYVTTHYLLVGSECIRYATLTPTVYTADNHYPPIDPRHVARKTSLQVPFTHALLDQRSLNVD